MIVVNAFSRSFYNRQPKSCQVCASFVKTLYGGCILKSFFLQVAFNMNNVTVTFKHVRRDSRQGFTDS